MAGSGGNSSNTLIEAAIARVLEAERGARDAIDVARGEAAPRVDIARTRAIEIARHAERRITRIQNAFEQRVESSRHRIEAQIRALAHDAGDDPQIQRRAADAVNALVADWTGGDRD